MFLSKYHKLYDILKQHQNEVNKIRAERLTRTANPLALVAQQQPDYHHQNHPTQNTQYSLTKSQQSTRNRGKAIVTSSAPTYDPEPATVIEDEEMSKEKEIAKLMALISLSFKKIYKLTNNNLRTSSNTSRVNQDNSPRINRGTGYDNHRAINVAGARENVAYHKEKMLLCKQEEAGVQLNAEQADWKDDTDDESDDQELEAHYMYMAQIQEVTPDPVDNSGPIFDDEPMHKVQNNNDNYNVFAMENEHPEQPESSNDIYLAEHGDTNITIDSLDICYDRTQDDQDDTDDLDQERDLLASLIQKLKCEIDDSKNRNKFLESLNKELVDKLKGEIEDFKTKNKSLESSNNHFKEANNELSKTNQLMFKDLKKFQAELDKYNDVNYASKVEIDCAKAKGDLMSYKIDFEKSSTAYTQKINDLNQTISDMKKELCAYQETISIMSQAKEAQIKLYKTREDKELDKVINKVKVLNDIVYKTGQSVQAMNMLNRNCKMSFAKLEFLKKAQRANPRSSYEIWEEARSKDYRRNFKFSNNKTSVTACNDSSNANTSNVNLDLYTCGKCVLNDNHDLCVLHYINGVNSRTRQPMAVPISTREPKHNVNQSVATSSKKTVATDSTVKKSRHITRKLYEQVSKTCSWWYPKYTPPGYNWKPKSQIGNVNPNISMPLGNASRTTNILEHKTPRCSTVSNTLLSSNSFIALKFGNDQIAPNLSYGDLVQGTITIKWVYYVKGLNHNLFSVGQFCDADLQVAFWKSTCYIRDLQGNDLLTGSCGTDLYSITLQDSTTPNPICLMAKATLSQAWLWHRRLSHLNFDTINLLSKNNIVNGLPKLKFVKDHLGLHAQVKTVQTDNGTEFLNNTLHAYFAKEGIRHETSTARTPQQNGVVERRNRTLVEATRTMLSAAKVPLYFWAEAIATTCFTQNCSL
ncbi:retrovirus-related pol polyprotein from transposon TNT 1-94 [Tanacetum coccineum]